MQTHTIHTYLFDELSDEYKKNAIEKNRDINVEYMNWDGFMLEEWTDKLKAMGYDKAEILYSGFGSQGDGACFTARVDIEKWLRAHMLEKKYKLLCDNCEGVTIDITHTKRYYYATSTNVELNDYNGDMTDNEEWNKQAEEVTKRIEYEREELGDKIYKDLYNLYFELLEDECIAETLRANDYEFLEDGSRCYYI